jgi:hypothetical protein
MGHDLPVRPGAAVAAPGGGNEAVRIAADNIILDDILAGRPLGVGPVRLGMRAKAPGLLEGQPVDRAPVLRAACC